MQLAIENHGDLSCEITLSTDEAHHIGTLKYRVHEVGLISGSSINSVRAQFRTICEMVEAGGMVRYGIIMLGYHNRAFKGDVLLVDGEIIGEWTSDDEEWCHFTAYNTIGIACSAPSPWMLHESIANWIERSEDTKDQ